MPAAIAKALPFAGDGRFTFRAFNWHMSVSYILGAGASVMNILVDFEAIPGRCL